MIAEIIEGEVLNSPSAENGHYICDWCSSGVNFSSNQTISLYISDNVLAGPNSDIIKNPTTLGSYCEDCTLRLLYFPHEGSNEWRILAQLEDDGSLYNVEETDHSPSNDGIPWEPINTIEEVSGYSPQKDQLEILMGAENFFTTIVSMMDTVKPQNLINPDGSLDRKVLGRARREWLESAREVKGREDFRRMAKE